MSQAIPLATGKDVW